VEVAGTAHGKANLTRLPREILPSFLSSSVSNINLNQSTATLLSNEVLTETPISHTGRPISHSHTLVEGLAATIPHLIVLRPTAGS
jgi:hypothetical protein